MFLGILAALMLAGLAGALPAGQIALSRMYAYACGVSFMLRANDLPKSYKGSNIIRMSAAGRYEGGRRTIRVVFIRHGESVWNSLFNSFGLGWPKRVVQGVAREVIDFFTKPFGSVIIDSPLSAKGHKEAKELAAFFRSASGKVSFDPNTSAVVCSNLRRAMETAYMGVGPRLAATGERIIVDSALQEGSRNIDAQTLSTESRKLAPVVIGSITDPTNLCTAFDPRLNDGGKVIGVDVYGRMNKFLLQLFGGAGADSLAPASNPAHGNADLKEVIVVGHSGYFRNFFRRFLPASSAHVAKKSKMQNVAVVAFDLSRSEATGEVIIEESSIRVLFKGFK